MRETDEKIGAGNAKGGCYVSKLDDIDSSLAILIFGDEGLGLAERGGQFRLLDAEADRADWSEVARIVLHRDPADAERTRICWESHLARAQWMTKIGYRKILEQAVIDARATRH